MDLRSDEQPTVRDPHVVETRVGAQKWVSSKTHGFGWAGRGKCPDVTH